ncbi:MAG: S49 family peptidase, partial [Cyanobacteria bacterium REEB65]|nr:S49 family peptidase [Cyanobacteria bacterium REEB65]
MNDLGLFALVPFFARIHDYVGLWAITEDALMALADNARRMDWDAHFGQTLEPRAAIEKVPVMPPQTPGGRPSTMPGPGAPSPARSIAVVKLSGLLMKGQSSLGGTSTIQARRDIRQAANDPEVGGIMLAIDSPGGTVAGTQDLADDVRAAAQRKPVWAHIDDLGASAAYWVASQAHRVFANAPTALVGSIGTVHSIKDTSGQESKKGIKTLVIATGPLKGMGTPGAPITKAQQDHLQGLANSVQASFDQAVQSGRRMTP